MPEEREQARLPVRSPTAALTVSQLNRSVRDAIEHRFPLLWVRGEISNCIVARSGHVYFALKDSEAQIRCVMFRSRADRLGWDPCDGAEVEVQGLVTLYEPRGDFQLVVEFMRRGGRGALFAAFQQLKEKLEKEGLFDPAIKRPIPYLPRAIGIVTSLQAAALHDVLSTLQRRNPSIPVIIYPSPVQGDAAALGLARALRIAGARAECDVLILCRGGGSIEDLWPFNEERVARAIRACPIPVVSGVGHETDFSIADFAADRRATTPTGAAEMVSPEREELRATALGLVRRMSARVARELQVDAQTVDHLSRRLTHPARRLREAAQNLDHLRHRLGNAAARTFAERSSRVEALARRVRLLPPRVGEIEHRLIAQLRRMQSATHSAIERHVAKVEALAASLGHLSPERVLERGYSLVRDAAGALVRDARALSAGDELEISFANGAVSARVENARRER